MSPTVNKIDSQILNIPEEKKRNCRLKQEIDLRQQYNMPIRGCQDFSLIVGEFKDEFMFLRAAHPQIVQNFKKIGVWILVIHSDCIV